MDHKPYIVCIDDDDSVRESFARILTDHFGDEYAIATASSGEEGIALIEYLQQNDQTVALAMSDQRMATLEGIQTLALIHDQYPTIKRALVTAYGQDIDLVKRAIAEAQVDGFIDKPIYPAEQRFLPTIRKLLLDYQNAHPTPETTLVDVLRKRARWQPEDTAFRFLNDGEGDGTVMTYSELDRQARTIAVHLQQRGLAHERALMFYPSGIEFISAFFGCLYSGVVSVPAYPPRRNRNLHRLLAIIQDAKPAVVLSTDKVYNSLLPMLDDIPELKTIPWVCTDAITLDSDQNLAEQWQKPTIDEDTLAFLQYTSGSTGQPKGVMLTHGNLLHNEKMMDAVAGFTPQDIGLGWLPLFHDMGLIGLVLQPLYKGIPSILMPPAAFLQQPFRWLEAMSRFKATASAAPNFAFDLCVQEISEEQKRHLDLSHWRFVLSGAEPVRHDTIEQFSAAFARCGFRKQTFFPGYGLAEATLMVTSKLTPTEPVYLTVSSQALEQHRVVITDGQSEPAQIFVGNGQSILDGEVVIADPQEHLRTAENGIGEIWVKGKSIAQGYWQQPETSIQTFQAYLADTGAGPFMRTGDLGFIYNNELFVTGRMKDLIIIRGRNHYPQDIEWTIDDIQYPGQGDNSPLARNSCSAFTIDSNGSEQLVIAIELDRHYQRDLMRQQYRAADSTDPQHPPHPDQIIAHIRQAVAENHELQCYDIVLLKVGNLPKTSSGKVQRQRAKQYYLDGQLEIAWSARQAKYETAADSPQRMALSQLATDTSFYGRLAYWLAQQLARRLKLDLNSIDLQAPLASYGLDSVNALRITGDLELYLDRAIPQNLLWDYDTLDSLARYLVAESETLAEAPLLECYAQEAGLQIETTDLEIAEPETLPVLTPEPEAWDQPFPLNAIQQAYWFGRSQAFTLGNTACHFYAEFDQTNLDLRRLSHAWQQVIQRHGMLRAQITADGQQQIAKRVPSYTILVDDGRALSPSQQAALLQQTRSRMSHQIHNAQQWPLFEIRATLLTNNATRLHVSFDLLIADVWSFILLFSEWYRFYETPTLQLPPLTLSFRDYILAEQAYRQTPAYQQALEYWRHRLTEDSIPPAPDLPLAKNPGLITCPQFVRRSYKLNASHWKALKQRAQNASLTPSIVLCAAYAEVLGRWSKSPQFTLNLTLFNRLPLHPQVNQLVGDFTSLILLAIDQRPTESFEARAQRLQKQLWQDLAHRQVNGVEVLREMAQQRGQQAATMPVVFTSALGLQELQGLDVSAVDWLGERVYSISQTPQVWLDQQVLEEQGALLVSWDGIDELFPEGMLDTLFTAYTTLLGQLATTESIWFSHHLPLIPAAQLQQRAVINDTAATLPITLLHEPFLQQAQQHPERIAVISPQRQLNYGELAALAHQTGRYLREQGAKPNQLVAVVMAKGWEQVVACLGILQAGAAYLPIDPALPQERIDYLLRQTNAQLVLTQSPVFLRLQWLPHLQVSCLDQNPFVHYPAEYLEPIQSWSDLAYTIFTSGSTGIPKGVMIDHRGAVNTILDMNPRCQITPKDRVLALSSLSFDLSVYDLFGLLGAGAALVMPDAESQRDPAHWLELMQQHQVTLWNSAPALMKMALEYCSGTGLHFPPSLRLALFSGDWIPVDMPNHLWRLAPQVKLISLGGATEASIWSIAYPITQIDPSWRSIPYGQPMLNQQFQVYDSHLRPCPVWVPGQLYIGGIGLAMGYWNDTAKTCASFIKHPITGQRLYATGDLGRYLPDGNIEFLGREDFQVKIQGHRIELGEIEAILNQHPSIKESVVIAHTQANGEKQLVAYLVSLLDIARFSYEVPCLAVDHLGHSLPTTTIDIDEGGLCIKGAAESWSAGQHLRLHLALPGLPQEQCVRGVIAWNQAGNAGIRLAPDDPNRDKFKSSLTWLQAQQDVTLVDVQRFKSNDPLRHDYRAPWQSHCQAKTPDQIETSQVATINISSSGMQLTDIPADWRNGQALEIALFLPTSDERLWLAGRIMWRTGNRAGVLFNSTERQRFLLEQAVTHIIKTEGHWFSRFTLSNLKTYLEQQLPHYMVPKIFMLLDALPLSNNGKVDRKALPEPSAAPKTKVAATTPLQQKIADIWQQTLGIESIGADENFFELGGYSQLAVRLIMELREKLGIELPIRALFEAPTIIALAERIEQLAGAAQNRQPQIEWEAEALYGHYARRGIAHRIEIIRADKAYSRAQGQYLYYQHNGEEIEILDMVGGYGSAILGHNNPELVALAQTNLANQLPVHAQHSNNIEAGRVAQALSRQLQAVTQREFIATLASTGTEAIEAAIKHAKMEIRGKANQQAKHLENMAALIQDQYRKQRLSLKPEVLTQASVLFKQPITDLTTLYQAIREHNQTALNREPLFIALSHSFHGMTSGALSLTASYDFRNPFYWMGVRSRWIPHRADGLQAAIRDEIQPVYTLDIDHQGFIGFIGRDWLSIAALLIEPIQGEGGIHPVNREFVQAARHLADQYGFPIIVDEIQCGMGRSGTFTAAEQAGLRGDYYIFSKSLGGGLAKISALMVDEHRYQADFGYLHGSTFAEDKPACSLALKTLEIINRDQIMVRCQQLGQIFTTKLQAVRQEYPGVIKEVRGAGLMLGIELNDLQHSPSFLLRALSSTGLEMVNLLIAGYLLNVHRIRIAPTKTRNTIRFLPSAYITEAEMDQVINALEEVCTIIHYANAGRLLRYLVTEQNSGEPIHDWRFNHPPYLAIAATTEPKVAHIGHAEDIASLLLGEPSLQEVPSELREVLLERLFPYTKPALGQQLAITTATGDKVHLSIIGLPLTGALFEKMMRGEERELLLEKIDEAVALAEAEGCRVIGFGGYTSIVTLNCTAIANTRTTMTSGNALTAALAIEAALSHITQSQFDPDQTRIAIIGAKGNIGSICARIMAEESPQILLLGRNINDDGLIKVADQLFTDAWQTIQDKPVAELRGLAKAIYPTQTVQQLLSFKPNRDTIGSVLRQQLAQEFGGQPWVQLSAQFYDLQQCDIIISATNSSQPVIKPEHLSERVALICDVATPKDVDPQVFEVWPNIKVMSGGLAQLPNQPGIQLLGTRLPLNHVYGCVAETTLLGVAQYKQHFSFGEMEKDQVHTIRQLANLHGYTLGNINAQSLEIH